MLNNHGFSILHVAHARVHATDLLVSAAVCGVVLSKPSLSPFMSTSIASSLYTTHATHSHSPAVHHRTSTDKQNNKRTAGARRRCHDPGRPSTQILELHLVANLVDRLTRGQPPRQREPRRGCVHATHSLTLFGELPLVLHDPSITRSVCAWLQAAFGL